MEPNIYNVLFICTGNSARSILAEALMNQLGGGRFRAYSAGSHPKGELHPLTLKTLAAQRLPADGYRSKSWEEFARPGSPELHFVFTVCDQAAGEVCPVWPGQPISAHWGMPDPAAAPEAQREQAFVDTFVTLKRRIQLMLALPLASLDRIALRREVRNIGTH
ncbi:arsenate reductase ArsC [Rubrivivax gelatinosus]|uniref:Protein-tyrosine-phosphatase n=1 Tax=Rubrivivax gelatinosus TaxID=28068 RepID=A0ABS1DT82_RUBGE|nr:arsenate reductase ArsC [Rubrivivax gelatinosus]MBK1712668.1 protein-tyrosine-phosphatase [Rubrivivax gelatinosus]